MSTYREIPIFSPGDKIDGQYIVKDVLGSGGFGHVYLTEPDNGIQFAVKQPKREILARPDLTELIFKEADHWNELGLHPNVAYCYFVKLIDEVPYIFIEYVPGGTLKYWIDAGECNDMASNLDMAIQLCHGIDHAHNKGLLHRDIKPGNILMTELGIPKITDFGLSGPGGALHPNMGSPAYMAPERFIPGMKMNESSDIFSFGICLWEIFCNGEQPYMFLRNRHFRSASTPRELNELISDELEKVLIKCIEKDPDQRYRSFDVLRQALNEVYQSYYQQDCPFYEIELPDSLASDLNNRGFSFYQIGEEQKARECWESALKADPKHLEATFNLGCLKWKNAEDNWSSLHEKLDQTGDRSAKYWLCKGWIYFLEGDDEAIVRLQSSKNEILNASYLTALSKARRPKKKIKFSFKSNNSSSCFSPDGQLYLFVDGEKLRLFDTKDGEIKRDFFGYNGEVYTTCFSPDCKYVLSGGDRLLYLWEVSSGTKFRQFQNMGGWVLWASFSKDSKRILCEGAEFGSIALLDIESGNLIKSFTGHDFTVSYACFSPDGKYILSGSDDTIRLWDITSEKEIMQYNGHTDFAQSPHRRDNSLSFSPDGKLFASVGTETIKLWEVGTGVILKSYRINNHDIPIVCFSPNGNVLLLKGDFTIRLWEIPSGREIRQILLDDSIDSTCFYSDSEVFYSTYQSIQLLKFYHSGIDSYLKSCFPILCNSISPIEIIKKANVTRRLELEALLAIKSNNEQIAYRLYRQIQSVQKAEFNSKIIDLIQKCSVSSKRVHLINSWKLQGFQDHHYAGHLVSFSSNNQSLLFGGDNYSARLCKVETGSFINEIHSERGYIRSIGFSPDGKYILLGEDQIIGLFSLQTRETIRKFSLSNVFLYSSCFSPDSRFILSAGDKTIILWDVPSGKEIKKFNGHSDFVFTVCFSPNGRLILSGGADKTVRLWDVFTTQEILRFDTHRGVVGTVCFSPDGRLVLSGSWDGTIILSDISGKELTKFNGHEDAVNSVSFSPDGKFILSGSADQSARIWEIANNKEIRKFIFNSPVITSEFSPNGRWCVCKREGKIDLWELDWELEFPEKVDWHVDAEPYVSNFLTLFNSQWTQKQFDQFYQKLQCAGLGWIRKEGILDKIKELTKVN